jgi:prepilin-type N-terminal cleavage/methylation domain-containing protein
MNMPFSFRYIHDWENVISKGFGLLELMTSLVVVGILATVAFPSYRTYVLKAKVSETYVATNAIDKGQRVFFGEYGEFRSLAGSPARPNFVGGSDALLVVQDTLDLKELGYPLAVGSRSFFAYKALAGKTDLSGNDITLSQTDFPGDGLHGRVMYQRHGAPLMALNVSGPQACSPIINVTYFNGLPISSTTQKQYNWVVMLGYANFHNMNCNGNACDSCYVVLKTLIYYENKFTLLIPNVELRENFLQQ